MQLTYLLPVALASYAAAFPSLSRPRAAHTVNPDAITGLSCTDNSTNLLVHDIDVAQLQICGGIAGKIEFCNGNPSSTTGASGSAKFILLPQQVTKGATINVSKGRWEGCVRAAEAGCGLHPFKATCIGGTTNGNLDFELVKND